MTTELNLTWVEALAQVVDCIHDMKGVSGLSPYEIVHGRLRPLSNLPYEPEKNCEDASEFFSKCANKTKNCLNFEQGTSKSV